MKTMGGDNILLVRLEVKSNSEALDNSRRLKLALKKRQIVQEEVKRLRNVADKIQNKCSTVGKVKAIKSNNIQQDPFIIFYLKMFKNLCGRKNIQEISADIKKMWLERKGKPKESSRKISRSIGRDINALWGNALNRKDFQRDERDKEKVQLALMKNKILSEEISRLKNVVKKVRKKTKYSSNFVKLYLNVFRELCGKNNEEEITEETRKRWAEQRPTRTDTRQLRLTRESKQFPTRKSGQRQHCHRHSVCKLRHLGPVQQNKKKSITPKPCKKHLQNTINGQSRQRPYSENVKNKVPPCKTELRYRTANMQSGLQRYNVRPQCNVNEQNNNSHAQCRNKQFQCYQYVNENPFQQQQYPHVYQYNIWQQLQCPWASLPEFDCNSQLDYMMY